MRGMVHKAMTLQDMCIQQRPVQCRHRHCLNQLTFQALLSMYEKQEPKEQKMIKLLELIGKYCFQMTNIDNSHECNLVSMVAVVNATTSQRMASSNLKVKPTISSLVKRFFVTLDNHMDVSGWRNPQQDPRRHESRLCAPACLSDPFWQG